MRVGRLAIGALFVLATLASGCGSPDAPTQFITASIVNNTTDFIWAEGTLNSKVDFEGRMVDGPMLRIWGRGLDPGQNTTGEATVPTAEIDNLNITLAFPEQTYRVFNLRSWDCKDDPAVSATRLVVSVHDGAMPGSVEIDLWKSC